MIGHVFRAKTSVAFLLLSLYLYGGVRQPAYAQLQGFAQVYLNAPPDESPEYVITAWNGVNAQVYFNASPVKVWIYDGVPYSTWTVIWTMELLYTTRLGTGRNLVDTDDSGSCPATLNSTGYWFHVAHNNGTGQLTGTVTVAVGTWTAKGVSRMTAEPTGGGSSLNPSDEDLHPFRVRSPYP